MTALGQLEKNKNPQASLIDVRMKLFLGRQLRDILDHLPNQQDSKLAKRTRHALTKLKSNRFGTCEKCGYPIDIGRILVDPAVENCACCEHGLNCPVGHPLHLE